MLVLIILIELDTKSIDFVLSYTHTDVKSEIFMELPIVFGVEGSQPIEWFIIIFKNLHVLKDAALAWFEKHK